MNILYDSSRWGNVGFFWAVIGLIYFFDSDCIGIRTY